MIFFRSLFFKTIFVSFGLIVTTVSLFTAWLIPFEKKIFLKNLESSARIVLASVNQTLGTTIISEDYTAVVEHCTKIIKERNTIRFVVVTRKDGFSIVHSVDAEGNVNWETGEMLHWIPDEARLNHGLISRNPLLNEDIYHYVVPFVYSYVDWGYIHVGLAIDAYTADMNTVYRTIGYIIPACIAFAMLIAFLYARQLTKPIQSLEKIARTIGMGDLSIRARIRTGDEIQSLASSLNQMADNLYDTQKEIIEARDYIENVIKSVTDLLIVCNPDGKIVTVNDEACNFIGITRNELRGKSLEIFFHNSSDFIDRVFPQSNLKKQLRNLNADFKNHFSEKIPVLISISSVFDEEGICTSLVYSVKDISEIKKAEASLIHRSRFENLLISISNRFINTPAEMTGVLIRESLGMVGEFIDADRSYLLLSTDISGFFSCVAEWHKSEIESVISTGNEIDFNLFPWIYSQLKLLETIRIFSLRDIPENEELFIRFFEAGQISSLMMIPVEFRGRLFGVIGFDLCGKNLDLQEDDIKFLKLVSEVFVNALERKNAEEALAKEKETLAVTLRSIADAVIATDINGNILIMNKTAEQLTGWHQAETAGKKLKDIFNVIDEKTRQPYLSMISKILETGAVEHFSSELLLFTKDEQQKIIANSVSPIMDQHSNIIGVVLVFRDITESRKMENELQKTQKLESLGILAGGIAHDFNNLLTGILGNISLARFETEPGSELHQMLLDAEEAASRSKDLTQQLLTFSKGGAPIKKIISIAHLLKSTAQFCVRGTSVKCEFLFDEKVSLTDADEGQLSQVIHNLVINAMQAMPSGGIITLTAKDIEISRPDPMLPEGKYVYFSIRDQGCGIPDRIITKIFDPFFTTKAKGSGLGLATTYSIIKKHGGFLKVSSEEGKWTLFEIFLLPASSVNAETRVATSQNTLMWHGKVLLMDDEKVVHKIASKILSRFGMQVVSAYDADTAVNLFEEARKQSPFDLVILDLTIPGSRGGKDVISELIKIDPEVKALVSSGHSSDPVMASFKDYGFSGVIPKPYLIEEVAEALSKVLGAPDRKG